MEYQEAIAGAEALAKETGREAHAVKNDSNDHYYVVSGERVVTVRPEHDEKDLAQLIATAKTIADNTNETQFVVTGVDGDEACIYGASLVHRVEPEGIRAIPIFKGQGFPEQHYTVKELLNENEIVYSAQRVDDRSFDVFIGRRPRLEDGYSAITTRNSRTNLSTIERAQDPITSDLNGAEPTDPADAARMGLVEQDYAEAEEKVIANALTEGFDTPPRTIDLTPTWAELMPVLIDAIMKNDDDSANEAAEVLIGLAQRVDNAIDNF